MQQFFQRKNKNKIKIFFPHKTIQNRFSLPKRTNKEKLFIFPNVQIPFNVLIHIKTFHLKWFEERRICHSMHIFITQAYTSTTCANEFVFSGNKWDGNYACIWIVIFSEPMQRLCLLLFICIIIHMYEAFSVSLCVIKISHLILCLLHLFIQEKKNEGKNNQENEDFFIHFYKVRDEGVWKMWGV